MSERSPRARINAAFEDELRAAPVPAGLRPVAIQAAVAAPRPRSSRPALLAVVAAVVVLAIVATLVVGSNLLRSTPVPSGSTTPPPARQGAAVAYDAQHGVLVLFGGVGSDGTGMLGDTWTFDGKLWRHLHPPKSPQPRSTFAIAYDQAHHDVVLFGGMAQVGAGKGGLQQVDDTWTWNGTTWNEAHPAHEPGFGYDWGAPAMQYDPISKTVLMYGYTRSTSEAGAGIRAETWSWNGSDWTQIANPGGPATIGSLLDDGERVLLIAEPAQMIAGRSVTQTWAWSGARWTLLHPAVDLPSAIAMPSAAYDSETHQLVLLTAETWIWNGATWSRAHPTLQPPAAGYMAYIPSLHEVVSWDDVNSGNDYGLYGWNGTDWKVITPGTATPSGGKAYTGVMTPEQAAAAVRAQVTDTHPVLLPSFVPAGWDATVFINPDGFTVRYQSDQRDKSIEFGAVVANPPPGGPSSKDTYVKFRNALPLKFAKPGYAEYFVYDPTVATSNRWLTWIEPGTTPGWNGGVPYFLSTTGLTDAEFWQVANSLR
jgi:hypothetical protein